MKLFTTKQIAELDKFTIENEPISAVDLMERAALQITHWIIKKYSTEQKIVFFAGSGNNGGDVLAIARQLADFDYQCEVYLVDLGKELQGSPKINWLRLVEQQKVKLCRMINENDFPKFETTDLIIDGLFGSGLSRALEGLPAAVVQKINQLNNTVISIDIPSGLMGEDNTKNRLDSIVRANFTLTFQFPKISFLFAENEIYTGKWEVLPIRLHPEGIETVLSEFQYIEKNEVQNIFVPRTKFAHKGTFGHALLIAGSYGKMGAAVLASKACLRSGAGLLTTHIPRLGYSVLQTAVPEAMASIDQHDSMFTEFPDLNTFSAVGIGPGLNKKQNSKKALCELLDKISVPLVIDADGLNILAENKDWLQKLPENTILTPHPGEFARLVGESENSYCRLQKQLEFSKKYKVVLIVKGAFTCVTVPSGKVYFNSTGNPGMATAGSGDVLTGVILGLLAQGINPHSAAVLGVFVHGLAGDTAADKCSETALIASDIIQYLGKAFLSINSPSTK
ncbi:MAG: NAD(P)H-hydrate dehydratase [Prolixibacteraceae bacterium]|nr:NAD(P)H-hydrate dehydratase [Prolixibacteraceae bacterium]